MVADEFLELVKERGHENLQGVAATAKTIKGLVELVKGNTESGREKHLIFTFLIPHYLLSFMYSLIVGAAESLFGGLENHDICKGTH